MMDKTIDEKLIELRLYCNDTQCNTCPLSKFMKQNLGTNKCVKNNLLENEINEAYKFINGERKIDENFIKVTITEKGEVKVIADKNFIKMDKRKRADYLEVTRDLIIQLWIEAEEVAEDGDR